MVLNKFFQKNRKSQTSIEVIVLLSIVLVILGLLISSNMHISSMFVSKYSKDQIKLSLDSIKSSADAVYSQGKGAKDSIIITLPSGIKNSSIVNQTLIYEVYSGDSVNQIYRILDYNISGTLPFEEGQYKLSIESFGGYVNVSY